MLSSMLDAGVKVIASRRRAPVASAALAAAIVGAPAVADLTLERSGFGSIVRFGGIVPMQVLVSLPAGDRREGVDAELVIEVPGVDGDIAEYSTRCVLSSEPSAIWVYPSVATGVSGKPLAIASHERTDGGRGALIERVTVDVVQPARGAVQVAPTVDIIGVVAGGHCGMAAWDPGARLPSLSGFVSVAERMEPQELPERVEGWSGFKAVVVAGAPLHALLPAQDQALRAWVEAGGRLVLQESAAAGGFALDGKHPAWITDALAGLAWERREGVSASVLLPVICSYDAALRKDAVQPVTIFSRVTAPWVELAAMPVRRAWNGVPEPRQGSLDGACLVAERPFGSGTLVVSGLDADALQRRRLLDADLPEADTWWNRIMGRRGDTPPRALMRSWADAKPPLVEQHVRRVTIGSAEFFNAFIGMRSTAANLTTISILLFAAYWVLAGPASFYLLRQRRLEQWSWLVFIMIAVVFGAIAWGAGVVLRQSNARAQHLMVVDAVVMPDAAPGTLPAASTRLWASVFLPHYGRSEVSLPEGNGTLRPFSPVNDEGEFPDATRFTVSTAKSGVLTLPARATATMVAGSTRADLPAAWRGLPSVGAKPLVQTAHSTRSSTKAPASYLTGELRHALPGALTDVLILHVTPFRPAPPALNAEASASTKSTPMTPTDAMPSMVLAARLTTPWEPGTAIELANILYRPDAEAPAQMLGVGDPNRPGDMGLESFVDKGLVAPLRAAYAPLTQSGALDEASARTQLTMMSLYGMLPSPRWWAASAASRGPTETEVAVERVACHDLDLSPWCSRPCVIVMGFLSVPLDAAGLDGGPVTLSVDGDPVPSSGTTLVRVIFPLPQVDALVPATATR